MEGNRRRPGLSFWAEPTPISAFEPPKPIIHTDTGIFGHPVDYASAQEAQAPNVGAENTAPPVSRGETVVTGRQLAKAGSSGTPPQRP